MASPKLPKGISDFRELREGGFYFVDKSQFIAETIAVSSKILLIPRPRRFGKTLNMTMLQAWFEKLPIGQNDPALFSGLKVETIPGEHHQKRGKLPVIFLSFKDVKEPTWGDTFMQIALQITLEMRRLQPWWQHAAIDPLLRADLEKLLSGKADRALLTQSLRLLTQTLKEVSGEAPLILIDEYDTPIQAGLVGDFFTNVVDFFRNFLSAGLKDNPFLGKGVLTGILRVSKENIFSGLNNLDVCSLTNSKFSSCFGLLEYEVEELLHKAGSPETMPEVRKWYNGYLFGKNTIYNPWSVISFAADSEPGCLPHWVNTSNNQLLGNALADGDGILHRELEDLLSGGTIEKSIDDNVTYSPEGIRPNDVWSFLLYTGYLTVQNPMENRHGKMWGFLRIPNEEVKIAFEQIINEWTGSKIGRNEDVAAMLNALATGDKEEFAESFTKIVQQTLSFHDVRAKQAESFYHAFVTGMLVNLSLTHTVRSNRESGDGRYDVMLLPKNTTKFPGVVIEFKLVAKNQSPEEAIAAAHQQIEDKKYATELEAHGCTKIIKWAIAFRGKEVFLDMLANS